jgi:hypothetical protein
MYSDTTHGRFIERMDLARVVLRQRDQKVTQAAVLRLVRRHDNATLRRIVANGGRALSLCALCDGDGFGPDYVGNCPRCGGSGKEI